MQGMNRSIRWVFAVVAALVAASPTEQYGLPVDPMPVPQEPVPVVPPMPTETGGYYANPAFVQPVGYRPYHQQLAQLPQVPPLIPQVPQVLQQVAPGRLGMFSVLPQQPIFQTPEPVTPNGFLGHAPFFQKLQQEQAQQQQALMQSLHAQRLQMFHQQQQSQQMVLVMQRQQFLQQLHPFMRQQFLQLNPVVQQQVVQRFFEQQQQQQQQAAQQAQEASQGLQRQNLEQSAQEQPSYQ